MGIPAQNVELDVAEDMIFKGLTIQCIVGRRLYETWDTMRALLASGRLDVAPCDHAPAAVRAVRSRHGADARRALRQGCV